MAPSQQQQRQRGGGGNDGNGNGSIGAAPPQPPPLLALITGAAPGGIGHALALDLAARPGWRVIATARRKDQLRPLADLPGVEAALELDVASSKSVEACRRQVDRLTKGQGVDVLVNNAGVNVKGTVLDTDMQAIERLMAVNVQGTVAVTKAFAPAMAAKRRGLIVNVGSTAGYAYGPVEACYAASKAAVRSLTDGLRVELAPLGVKVMLAAPGFVKTRIDDQPGRGAAAGLWFPPRAPAGGGASSPPTSSGGGSSSSGGGAAVAAAAAAAAPHPSSSAAAASPYALYGWMSRVVRSSIFELGPGVLHDSPGAFAARLARAIDAEAPRAPRPAPWLARRALAAAAGGGKQQQGAGPLRSAAAAPSSSASSADAALIHAGCPLPPPSALDMIAGWRWWAPHALGGPRRHFRAAPFAVVTWLVGALAPLWVADLVLGLYMGLWTAL